jgi:hypothetical protein
LNDIPDDPRFLTQILPSWDDTPRYRQNGVVYDNFAEAVSVVESRPQQEAIIFIKAWNDWAEGNYLEPDAKFGHAYLDAMRSVLGLGQAHQRDLAGVH